VVDLGPEGGDGGGKIIAVGTPEQIAANKASYTGHYLQATLGQPQAQLAQPARRKRA
jgi:excinuclease ABC subunit A